MAISPQKRFNNKKRRLAKKCNDLWRTIVLLRNPSCWHTGRKAEVAHHYIAKSLSNALRYDTKNGVSLTNGSHFTFHNTGDPEILEKFLKSKDEKWHTYIRNKRRQPIKITLPYYENKIIELEEELNKLL